MGLRKTTRREIKQIIIIILLSSGFFFSPFFQFIFIVVVVITEKFIGVQFHSIVVVLFGLVGIGFRFETQFELGFVFLFVFF